MPEPEPPVQGLGLQHLGELRTPVIGVTKCYQKILFRLQAKHLFHGYKAAKQAVWLTCKKKKKKNEKKKKLHLLLLPYGITC